MRNDTKPAGPPPAPVQPQPCSACMTFADGSRIFPSATHTCQPDPVQALIAQWRARADGNVGPYLLPVRLALTRCADELAALYAPQPEKPDLGAWVSAVKERCGCIITTYERGVLREPCTVHAPPPEKEK